MLSWRAKQKNTCLSDILPVWFINYICLYFSKKAGRWQQSKEWGNGMVLLVLSVEKCRYRPRKKGVYDSFYFDGLGFNFVPGNI
jgi:hypothetical protein